MSLRSALSLAMPRRFLRGGHGRLALAIIALTCGVALVCAMALVSRAVLAAFVEVVDTAAGRASLTITAGGAPFPEAAAARVAEVPGVELAVPWSVQRPSPWMAAAKCSRCTASTSRTRQRCASTRCAIAWASSSSDPLVFLNQPDRPSSRGPGPIGTGCGWTTGRAADADGRRRFTVRGLSSRRASASLRRNLVVAGPLAAERRSRDGTS